LLASYLIMILPLLLACIFEAHKRKDVLWAILLIIAFILNFLALLFTKAVSAYLALTLTILFFIFLIIKEHTLQINWKKLLLVLGMAVFFFIAFFIKRADFFVNLKNPENSIRQRIYYWQSAVEMIKERPLVGFGAGSFGIVYPRFKLEMANETNYAHNLPLQLWAETGVIGLFIFVLFVIYLFRKCLKNDRDLIKMGVLFGSLAFLLHNIFDYSFYIPQVAIVFWVLVALVVKPAIEKNESSLTKKEKTYRVTLKYILVFLISFGIYYNLFKFQAQVNFEKGERALVIKKYNIATQYLTKAVNFSLKNDFAYYLLAITYEHQYQTIFSNLVIENYTKAISLNPHYTFYYFDLGTYFRKFRRIDEAKTYFQQALKLYPTNKKFQAAISELSPQN